MTGMDDLVTWLRAQLDEDERVARAAADLAEAGEWDSSPEGHVHDPAYTGPGWRYLAVGPDHRSLDDIGEHMAHWDPARVLAEVDAKRRILDLHRPDTTRYVQPKCHECSGCGCCSVDHPCDTIKLLALPFAERDGYREEWRP